MNQRLQCVYIWSAAGFEFFTVMTLLLLLLRSPSSKGRSVLHEEPPPLHGLPSKAAHDDNLSHFHTLYNAKCCDLWRWKEPNYFHPLLKSTSEEEPGKSGVGIAHVRLHHPPPPPPISIFSPRRPHFPLIEKSWEIELRVSLTFRLASPGSLSQDWEY